MSIKGKLIDDWAVGSFFYTFLFIFIFKSIEIRGQVSNWTVNNPFEQKVFIENKGQFDNANNLSGTEIKYVVDNAGVKIYFTPTGLIYEFNKFEKIKDDRDEKKGSYTEQERERESEREFERDERNIRVRKIVVGMQWQGANPLADLEVEEKVADYYTYADTKKKNYTIVANAYKKLIYKNLYNKIDVEYTFHKKEGIKYEIILHPGADAGAIKMHYTSAENVFSDAAGNIHFSTEVGDIIDHSPETFFDNDRSSIRSSFKLNRNTVSFFIENYDTAKTVIIDPWTTNPSFTGMNKAFDIDKDGSGNIYVSGGGSPFYLKKFSPGGVLVWTFTYTATVAGTLCYYGDHCVDNAGNSYLSYGAWGGGEVTKVNPSGTLIYSYLNPQTGTGTEAWRLTINCILGEITGGGFYNDPKNSPTLWSINPANGLISNYVSPHGGYMTNEIRALTNDEIGNIYALTVSMTSGPAANNRVIKTASSIGGGLSTLFDVPSGYTLTETNCGYALGGLYAPGFSGINAIAVGCDLYTFNGLTLKRWDKNSGTQLGADVNVPGGIVNASDIKNSGIVLDNVEMCT